jgi:hypothetical protein
VNINIAGHGGYPPYTYYNDTTLIAQSVHGSAAYSLVAPAGNPTPFKLIVVDSAGQRVMQDLFYKSGLHCGR